MGKVLPFRFTPMIPPQVEQSATAPGDTDPWDQPHTVDDQSKRDVLTGVVPPDAARYTDPMRRLTLRHCNVCTQEWQQPAATGNCPFCHSGNVATLDTKTIYAPRV